EDSGEHIVACAGELHLEICLQNLHEDDFIACQVFIIDCIHQLTWYQKLQERPINKMKG
ncbi:hypothetical protein MKX03_007576, partial [Papaver bracteatum]